MLKTIAATAGVLIAGLLAIPVLLGGDAPATASCMIPGPVADASIEVLLATIRQVESGGRYDLAPNAGGASGAYQYIDPTWRTWATQASIDTTRYPRAYLAPAAVQDQVAALNVRAILDQHHDIAAVPIAWYWPRALDHPEDLDIVPAPQAGNRLTVRQYQQRWLAILADLQAVPATTTTAGAGTTTTTPPKVSCSPELSLGTPADIQTVLSFALAQLGKPYIFGTAGPDAYDCSGLTKAAYHAIGIELPHYTGAQVTRGTPIGWRTEPIRPGDLVFTRGGSPPEDYGHVGIALDANRWINAPHTGDIVKIASMPTAGRIQAVRRLVQTNVASLASPSPSVVRYTMPTP